MSSWAVALAALPNVHSQPVSKTVVTLIEEFDMGEVLDRDIDTDLVPKRPPQAEEESEQSLAAAFGVAATSRFDHALDWINPLVGKMPYGFWHDGEVPSGSPAWALNHRPPKACWPATRCSALA